MKRDLERTIAKFPFGADHVFRPSLLRGYRDRPRADERWMHAVMPRIGPLLIGTLSTYRAIMAQDVGDACCSIARRQGIPHLPQLPLSGDACARRIA
jgi:hypothetical protein